jgi:hypothetical protein
MLNIILITLVAGSVFAGLGLASMRAELKRRQSPRKANAKTEIVIGGSTSASVGSGGLNSVTSIPNAFNSNGNWQSAPLHQHSTPAVTIGK